MKKALSFLACILIVATCCRPVIGFSGDLTVSPGDVAHSYSVLNFRNAILSAPFLNLAHTITLGSTSKSNWAAEVASDGYPSSKTPSFRGNNLALVSNYYKHYQVWWTDTGAFQIDSPVIVYSGGASTSFHTNSGSSFALAVGFNGAFTQPTSTVPVEFAFGALIKTIKDAGDCKGGTAGQICLTSSLSGIFGNYRPSGKVQVNNITNLRAQTYSFTKLDSNHIQLAAFYNPTMAINAGPPGIQSETIFAFNNLSWIFPAQGSFSTNYLGFRNLIICRSQNIGYSGISDCANIMRSTGLVGRYANPDYATEVKRLNPRFVRFMDISAVQGNTSTNYTYRPIPSQLSWSFNSVQPYLGGVMSNNTDAFTLANPSASPSSGAYKEGEIAIGQVPVSGTNTTFAPTLKISGREGAMAAPILSPSASQTNVVVSGTLPLYGSIVTMTFAGGGLGTGGATVNYTVQSSDTSTGALCTHLDQAINANPTLAAAKVVAINYDYAFPNRGFGSPSASQCSGSGVAGFLIAYNSNINSSGGAALGNGMTLAVSDNSGQGTFYGVGALYPGALKSGSYYSFTWSQQLQAWVASSISATAWGMQDGPPLEFYEDICLQANVGLWLNVPLFWDQNYVTQAVTNIANSGVKELAIEYGNEVWNNAEANWAPATHLGLSVGLKSDPQNGWYGLRVTLISATAKAAWAAAGRSASSLHIVNAYQFVNLSGSIANRFNGGNLNPSGNVTLAAFGNWGATPLSTNLSASPNRPIDHADLISGAPYWTGAQLNGSDGGGLRTSALANYNGLMLAAYNYAYGTPSLQTAALNWLYNSSTRRGDLYDGYDAYAGAVSTIANCGFTAGFWALGSGQSCAGYFGVGTTIARYQAGRVTAGLPPLGVANYEGDFQSGPITSAQITSTANSLNRFGYVPGTNSASTLAGAASGATCASTCPTGAADTSTLAATNMAALLLAFKNSAGFQALFTQQLADELAAGALGGSGINLVGIYGWENLDVWGKYNSSTIYSTPFTSWNAIQALDN